MIAATESYEKLIRSAARHLKGHQRRLFQAEVASALCGGNARQAERLFGWGRDTVSKGLQEQQQGIRCVENFSARGRPRWEDEQPQRAQDIRALVEPHTQADPELKSERRYTNLTAKELRQQLQTKAGYAASDLPSERSCRDILNRLGYRLKRIQKAKPLKKTPQTDAIFANVHAVAEAIKNEPTTLGLSIDTKAKVNEGDYSRGGKKPERCGRRNPQGLGS
jgi:DDE family transposase